MKRNIIIAICVLVFSGSLFAQKPTAESIRKRVTLGWGIYNDFWRNVPDSIKPRAVNQGVDVFFNYMFPMDKAGHVFFFAGAGLGAHNLYHQALLGVGKDNLYGKALTANANEVYLYNIPAKLGGRTIDVKKSKLSITYFDIPFGFRYQATNKIFATIGFKVGWKANAHTKYKGTDIEGTTNLVVIDKRSKLPNIESMHYGPFLELGYKWIGLSAFYQISPLYQEKLGPQLQPFSVGLVFRTK